MNSNINIINYTNTILPVIPENLLGKIFPIKDFENGNIIQFLELLSVLTDYILIIFLEKITCSK